MAACKQNPTPQPFMHDPKLSVLKYTNILAFLNFLFLTIFMARQEETLGYNNGIA